MELTGRITADAVIRTVKEEKQVVSFSIAINEYYKPKGATEGKEIPSMSLAVTGRIPQ